MFKHKGCEFFYVQTKGRLFKCKKDRLFVVLAIKGVSSYGSWYLAENFPEIGSSIAWSSWSVRSWLGKVFSVTAVNFILHPWFVSRSCSLEIVANGIIPS